MTAVEPVERPAAAALPGSAEPLTPTSPPIALHEATPALHAAIAAGDAPVISFPSEP